MHPLKSSNSQVQISDRVYDTIRDIVSNFIIKPGERIHIEELASKLNSSVTPVREALNRLLTEGLIIKCDRRGFRNRNIEKSEILDLINLRKSLTIGAFLALLDPINHHLITKMADDSNFSGVDLPYCARAISILNNREVIRIYNTMLCKIHIFWRIYSASDYGMLNLHIYKSNLTAALLARNKIECIICIEENFSRQLNVLDEVINQIIIEVFSNQSRNITKVQVSIPTYSAAWG